MLLNRLVYLGGGESRMQRDFGAVVLAHATAATPLPQVAACAAFLVSARAFNAGCAGIIIALDHDGSARVVAVADGSPVAQTKSVEPGDIVTQVNGQSLHFLFAAATH
jgi:S1-C subfamily serine protease